MKTIREREHWMLLQKKCWPYIVMEILTILTLTDDITFLENPADLI